ncbi:hypothetical protein I4U23_018654 [Adineta vaga]|nr:hypothetical protein I4U23_018654 [Adineta vaga]
MTSENQVENIPTIEITETNHKPDDEQEPTVLTNNPVEESVVQKTEADEGEEVHKPKRGGRKKREITAVSDVKAEHLNNEQETDTQPLFEQPVILEGKRSRKPTSRLELSDLETPKKEFSIPQVNCFKIKAENFNNKCMQTFNHLYHVEYHVRHLNFGTFLFRIDILVTISFFFRNN